MGSEKHIKIHNKSDKPDNVVLNEHDLVSRCEDLEKQLPSFLRGFFAYLRGNVLPRTRLSFLRDFRFFCQYLIEQTDLTSAKNISDIKLTDFNKIKATDVNLFMDYCRRYTVEKDDSIIVYENGNKTLARKKSSLSVMFKQLYRDELMKTNITDGFDPIRVPKAGEREIKALQDDEVMVMLDAVSTGEHLTDKERQYWKKTKRRDKAILVLFLTYGLRLFELQQLNVSSFNFSRGEFKIYRKRDKEAVMPLNESVTQVITDYLENERADDSILDETHKLRATAATSLIGRGNSIFDVQALMDHEQVTTTQLYAAHKMNVKRDLVNDMEWELERKERK